MSKVEDAPVVSEATYVPPQARVIQELARLPMACIERYTREDAAKGVPSYTIPGILPNGSKIVLVPRADDPTKFWRNEMGDVVELIPGTTRLVMQRNVILNWSEDRGTEVSDLDDCIAGLDINVETGERFTRLDLLKRLHEMRKNAQTGVVTAASPEAVFEA